MNICERVTLSESTVMSLSECDRQHCRNPALSLSGNKDLALWAGRGPVFTSVTAVPDVEAGLFSSY